MAEPEPVKISPTNGTLRAILAAVVLVLGGGAAGHIVLPSGQGERIARLEAQQTAIAERLDRIEGKLDAALQSRSPSP